MLTPTEAHKFLCLLRLLKLSKSEKHPKIISDILDLIAKSKSNDKKLYYEIVINIHNTL